MICRLLLALVVALACPAVASAQCFAASAELGTDGSGTYNLAVSSAVSAGDSLFVALRTTEEGGSISSVSDSVNGSWTLGANTTVGLDGGGTASFYIAHRLNSAAGTPTITLVQTPAAGGHMRVWACPAADTVTFEEWETPNIQGSATTPLVTPTGNATCSDGLAVGLITNNSSRSITSVDVGTNLSPITGFLHIVYLPFSASGTVGPISATMSSAARGVSHLGIFCQAGGGGGGTGGANLSLLGVGL